MKSFLLFSLLLTTLSLSSCALIVYDDDDCYDDNDSDSITIIFHQSPSPVGTDR